MWRFPQRVRQAEVLPVPQERVALLWKYAARWLREIPDYDLNRARLRLLLGEDRLWIAAITAGSWSSQGWERNPYLGAAITTVSNRQPFKWRPPLRFRRANPQDRRSLKVHLVGRLAGIWFDSAVERISAYGREQGCRMLFILARKHWRQYATRFYSPDWELVSFSRDRPTMATRAQFKSWNKVGSYRIIQPVPQMTMKHYNSGTMCYFQERSA